MHVWYDTDTGSTFVILVFVLCIVIFISQLFFLTFPTTIFLFPLKFTSHFAALGLLATHTMNTAVFIILVDVLYIVPQIPIAWTVKRRSSLTPH